jgi:hypothetical protein
MLQSSIGIEAGGYYNYHHSWFIVDIIFVRCEDFRDVSSKVSGSVCDDSLESML